MRKVLLLITLLALIASPIWAADISGTWTITMKSPMGSDESFDLVVKDAGGNLTITGTHPQLQALAGTGSLKGDKVTMNVASTGDMKVEFVFTGTVTGKKMAGTREIKMSGGGGGAPGGGGPPGGGGAPGGAPGGGGPPGGAPGGGAPGGGGPPGGGAPGGGGEVSNAFTAEMK